MKQVFLFYGKKKNGNFFPLSVEETDIIAIGNLPYGVNVDIWGFIIEGTIIARNLQHAKKLLGRFQKSFRRLLAEHKKMYA